MYHFHKLIAASSIVLATVAGATSVASTSVASAAPGGMSQVAVVHTNSTVPMRESPFAAFLGVAVVSCAQGALASVAIDVLRDVASGGPAPKYVEDAVISCIFGGGVGAAWKLLTPTVKKKVIAAVVAVVIGVSPLD